jgi:TonB-linked SusC/RagA family outer membrane protein
MYYNSTRFTNRIMLVYHTLFVKKISFFMKVNTILLIILMIAVGSLNASTGNAQSLSEVRITSNFPEQTLQAAFATIEKQTDFRFAYRKELISNVRHAAFQSADLKVNEILDRLLAGTALSYKQVNNSIIILKKITAVGPNVKQSISGTVLDETGMPMPGVSVRVKGTDVVTITNGSGVFTIDASPKDVLVFSFIGYVASERTAGTGSDFTIKMSPDISTLDAVVVVGYGTTTKRNNTGSVTSISAKDISAQPVGNPLAALQGRVAGLEISSITGYPGSGYSVRLRGVNSIGAGTDPLYIVDGVPFISESLSEINGANGAQSPLNSINPADIEQIDILKDADATAIYGSRGANGVILITTKKGRAGKPEISLNAYTGVSNVNNPVKMLKTSDYLELRKEAFKNDAITPTEANAADLLLWDQNLDQNWQKKLTGNSAALTEVNASIRGGSEQTNFLLSGTFRDEEVVLPGDLNYRRGSMNMSVNHSSTDNKLRISGSVKFTADENNTLPTDLTSFFNLAPNMPIYDDKGAYYWYGNEQNPMAYLERKSRSNTQNIFGDANISYLAAKGLTLRVTGGFNRMTMDQVQTLPKLSFNPQTYTGSMGIYGNAHLNSFIVEPQAEYTTTIGNGKLTALAGSTFQHSLRDGESTEGSGYSSDEQLENIRAATTFRARTYNYAKYRYTSVFGRLTYNLDEKYIINGTFRRDGSSRFGPEKQFGSFGAIGAAWIISSEDFLKDNLGFLSFAKLRGSYGSVGNDQIGNYGYLDTWSSTSYPYGGISGLSPTRFANPAYSWEVTRKLEGALELGFFEDRFLLSTNVYRNRSSNQLIDYALSPQSGFTGYTANLPALVQNTGVEFELMSNNITSGSLKWNTSLNMTFSKNKLLEYPDLENSALANTYTIGESLTIVKGFKYNGIDAQTGVPQFLDVDGDEQVSDPEDLVTLGQTMPTFFAGMNNSFTYKHLSLDFFFQFVKQEGTGLNYGYLSYSNGVLKNKDISALDRWRNPGDLANIPGASTTSGKPIYNAYQNQYRLSSANWVDASFIRLKNVSLRYDLGHALKKLKLNNLTVYVQGQNLFTITKYDGFDPETRGYSLPPLAVYTAGLRVSF